MIALVATRLTLATTSLPADTGQEDAGTAQGQPLARQYGQENDKPARAEMPAMPSYLNARTILGQTVRNEEQGQHLGKVEDLVVDLNSARAPFAIIGHGGALGIGETRVAVPLKELKWHDDTRVLPVFLLLKLENTPSAGPSRDPLSSPISHGHSSVGYWILAETTPGFALTDALSCGLRSPSSEPSHSAEGLTPV